MRIPFLAFLLIIFSTSFSFAQKVEVTISLNESFFDALLDAVFQHGGSPEISIAREDLQRRDAETQRALDRRSTFTLTSFQNSSSASPRLGGENFSCPETIKLLRESAGVRTAVRFRDGRILVPLAFAGNYNPPFVGCVAFGGWAESVLDLEFDQSQQRLVGRVRVVNVSLNGAGGLGGATIAKLVQSSIDKKINPIEIMKLDKISFVVPIQNSSSLRMRAVGVRHTLDNGQLNVHIAYEFVKG